MPLHRTTRRGIRTGRFGLGILVLSLLLVATALPTAAQEAEVGESSEESGSSPNAEAEAQQVVTAPEPPRVAPVAAVGEADRAVPWVQRSLPVIESVAVEVGLGATPAKVGVSDYLIAHPDTEWWFDVIVGFTPIVSDLDDFFGCLGGSGGSCAALAVPIAGGSALKGLGKAAGNATKSLGPVGNPGAFPGLSTTTSKLQHAFKHADDFGVTGNWNKAN